MLQFDLECRFLSSKQAIRYNVSQKNNDITQIIDKIIEEIKKDQKFESNYVDMIIKRFIDSDSFDQAGTLANELCLVNLFTENQINEIIKASVDNYQINSSFRAKPRVKVIARKFENLIDKKLLEKFKSLYYPQPEVEAKSVNPDDIPF